MRRIESPRVGLPLPSHRLTQTRSIAILARDSFRGDHGHIHDILDENLELVREVSIHDFRTAFERW